MLDADTQIYTNEQTLFLQNQTAFVTGNAGAGILALGHLKSMYRLLWYQKHVSKSAESVADFAKLLADTEAEVFRYARTHREVSAHDTIFKSGFRDLVIKFDKVVERYHQVITECEAK